MSCYSVQIICRSQTLECVAAEHKRFVSTDSMPSKDASKYYSNGYHHGILELVFVCRAALAKCLMHILASVLRLCG